MKACRLCLCQGEDHCIVSIFEYKVEDLASKILECVAIDISSYDELPKCICSDCIKQVLLWENFRNICQKSNEILLSGLELNCKELNEDIKNLDFIEVVKEELHTDQTKSNEESDEDNLYIDLDGYENGKLESEYYSDLPNETFVKEMLFYECEICHLYFDNCFEFLDHQYKHKGKDIFKCDKCPETFSTRQEIVFHDRTHKIPCPRCGVLILRPSMKLHLVKHAGRHKCSQCGSTCNSKAALKQHIITVHTNIKEHVCEVCGKRFSSISAMRVHNKIHSDDRSYPCKKCSYAGRTASALYIHMSTHANDFCICDRCSKVFKSNRNLNDHMRRAHSEIKKHSCIYCGKSFVDKYMLKVHIRWHTNIRPYKCTVCSKAFIRSDGLKEHMLRHASREKIECFKCLRRFTTKQGVFRHNCLAVKE